MKRLLGTITVLSVAAGIAAAALVGGGATASQAKAATPGNGLSAYVVAGTAGPLHPGDVVWEFIHVVNTNRLTNLDGGTTRATLPNAFAISSIDETVSVNGVQFGGLGTFTPPPDAVLTFWSGHWPSTVTCPRNDQGVPVPPCDVVSDPGVDPGENVSVLYTGWVHDSSEPNGTYVFRFVIHGTLNGTPVDLSANSRPIQMTG